MLLTKWGTQGSCRATCEAHDWLCVRKNAIWRSAMQCVVHVQIAAGGINVMCIWDAWWQCNFRLHGQTLALPHARQRLRSHSQVFTEALHVFVLLQYC